MLLIAGEWREGGGGALRSIAPGTGDIVWTGTAAGAADCAAGVAAARAAAPDWGRTSLDERIAVLRAYAAIVERDSEALAATIARETGKPLWEARTEVASMIGKVSAAIAAHAERAGRRDTAAPFGRAILAHRPHGVMAVLGPFNFPCHLPNGHIVPALLAGNTVVFKPSEETPASGEAMTRAFGEAGLPPGVLNLVQGGRDTGGALVAADIDGILFTGSAAAGAALRRATLDRPQVILALELGGNNPLIAWDGEPAAVASIIVQSAFATAGQRCSCARRLIVQSGPIGDAIVAAANALTARLRIGGWDDTPDPFMGSLISPVAAQGARHAYDALRAAGAKVIRPLAPIAGFGAAFLSPGLIDVSGLAVPDEEIFAPLLQITRVSGIEAAIGAANATRYGLAAGMITDDDALWQRYAGAARAGVLNRNRPTTGASGTMPFGGVGASGNHHPSGYYAADYCAYPVATFAAPGVADLSGEIRGLQ